MYLTIHPDNPNTREIGMVADVLANDGVVIYPTDSVYALGWDINSTKAFDRIIRIKGKSALKENFSMICKDISQISEYTHQINNTIFKMLKRNLPGPFTFILMASSNVPRFYKQKKKTVGMRIPDNNIPLAIVERLGHPIMTTSLHDEDNLLEYMTDPWLIYEKYENIVDHVIDGGYGNNKPSTVIDCTGDEPLVIRQGIGELI